MGDKDKKLQATVGPIFTKGALKKQDGKFVPAVVYDEDGNRSVIGVAKLHYDETGLGARIKIYDDVISDLLAQNSTRGLGFAAIARKPIKEGG